MATAESNGINNNDNEGYDGNSYLFTGQEYDLESELYYYNARYYNPRIGRFVSRDLIKGKDGKTLTRNEYIYTQNNPIRYTDPNGQYGVDFHFYNVYYLARTAGIGHENAYTIAKFSQYVDGSDNTAPIINGIKSTINGIFFNHKEENRLNKIIETYHFFDSSPIKTTNKNPEILQDNISYALSQNDYAKAGILLHIYADTWSHEGYSAYINVIKNFRNPKGKITYTHIMNLNNPDNPAYDVDRAMEASYAIYDILTNFYGSTGQQCSNLEIPMEMFSTGRESESERIEDWQMYFKDIGFEGVKFDETNWTKTDDKKFEKKRLEIEKSLNTIKSKA